MCRACRFREGFGDGGDWLVPVASSSSMMSCLLCFFAHRGHLGPHERNCSFVNSTAAAFLFLDCVHALPVVHVLVVAQQPIQFHGALRGFRGRSRAPSSVCSCTYAELVRTQQPRPGGLLTVQ